MISEFIVYTIRLLIHVVVVVVVVEVEVLCQNLYYVKTLMVSLLNRLLLKKWHTSLQSCTIFYNFA